MQLPFAYCQLLIFFSIGVWKNRKALQTEPFFPGLAGFNHPAEAGSTKLVRNTALEKKQKKGRQQHQSHLSL